MSHPPAAARGRLRLADPPDDRRRAGSTTLLAARAALAMLALLLLGLAALASAALALAPLAWRRAPRGRRLHPLRAPEARVIPFQPRRRVLPR